MSITVKKLITLLATQPEDAIVIVSPAEQLNIHHGPDNNWLGTIELGAEQFTDWAGPNTLVLALCDCGDDHPAREINDGSTLEWTCPKTGERKRDVNA